MANILIARLYVVLCIAMYVVKGGLTCVKQRHVRYARIIDSMQLYIDVLCEGFMLRLLYILYH